MTTKIFDRYAGIDNKHRADELTSIRDERELTASTLLAAARNVDISNTSSITRRKGFSQQIAGDCHSLWSNDLGTVNLVVKDSTLCTISPSDLSLTELGAVGTEFVSYADTGAGVYLSNGARMFMYSAGSLTELADAGTYQWPDRNVVDVTANQDFYDAPPPGHLVVWMFGRLWVATEYGVFFSRAFEPHLFDLRNDFIDIQNVTMIGAVDNGFYIGTDSDVIFYAGKNPKEPMQVSIVSDVGVPLRAFGQFPAAKLKEAGDGMVLVWESSRGKMLGLNGGQVKELNSENVAYDAGNLGAMFLREENGQSHIVSSLTGSSGEVNNMRASDSAEAEIWRNGSLI